MFKLILLFLTFFIIAWVEISNLLHKKLVREILVYLFLFVTGVGLSTYVYIGDPSSTPLEPIAKLYKPVIKVIQGIFQ